MLHKIYPDNLNAFAGSADEVDGGEAGMKEKNTNLQEGVFSGKGVLNMVNPRIDFRAPATTITNDPFAEMPDVNGQMSRDGSSGNIVQINSDTGQLSKDQILVQASTKNMNMIIENQRVASEALGQVSTEGFTPNMNVTTEKTRGATDPSNTTCEFKKFRLKVQGWEIFPKFSTTNLHLVSTKGRETILKRDKKEVILVITIYSKRVTRILCY